MTLQTIRHYLTIPALLIMLAPVGGCVGTTSIPPPSAPANLTVSSTVFQNTLTWAVVPGCTYNVYRGTAVGAEIAITSSDVTSYNDSPPVTSAAATYYYYVTALDTNGLESSPSNEIAIVSPALTLGAVTSTSVALSWTMPASATGITGYNVYRSTMSGAEATPALASTTTTSYSDTTVVPGTTYYYRVTEIGPNGEESFGSNEISATL